MSGRRPRTEGSRRRHWILGGAAGVFLLLALLGVLSLPLLGVQGDAEATQTELTEAMQALEGGNLERARESVAGAREHADDAQDGVQGLGGDIWSALPYVGTPVEDARHLVTALDDATSVAEIGVELYPSVAGERATLFRNQRIDRDTLEAVLAGAREAGGHLTSAEAALTQVEGSTPLVGDTIAARRDEALAEVTPLAQTFADVEPMLGELPGAVGLDGETSYLIALLNSADLRYSGGTPLAFAPMTWKDGKVDVGDSVDMQSNPRFTEEIRWPRVEGNYFHYRRPMQMRNATFAPSWSVSGEELLRAWQAAVGEQYDGVLAIDVVALSRLFEVTGGVTVPGHGRLTSDNLVEKLVGSYDNFYPDPNQLDELSAGIISPFKDRLFKGGEYVAKAKALGEAADGRHVAFYSRVPAVQEGMSALGFDGDLAEPDGDYLGVFSQSVLPSKSDYWQQRQVNLEVRLQSDGSAHNELDVRVHNDSPPYAVPGEDPGEGYFTRSTGFALSAFLPEGSEVEQVRVPGEKWGGFVGNFYDHDFVYQNIALGPQAQTRLRASYTVPEAASTEDDGGLTYRLTMDPHTLVRPEPVTVTLRLPDGYRAADLPEGWTADGGIVTWSTEDLASSEEWEIRLQRDN